ncbi:MAG: S9 family peptidase [Actinomycetes bacterium]
MSEESSPVAPRRPVVREAHGTTRTDDYAWLADRSEPKDPEVLAYLEAENRYADAMLEPTRATRDEIVREIAARILPVEDSAPDRKGPWDYFVRTFAQRPYAEYRRRPAGAPATEDGELLLDENALAEDLDFLSIGALEVSPDHRLLAYAIDTNGSERYRLRIRDLDTGADLDDDVPDLYYGVAWSADGTWLFYTRPDESVRPFQVWRHRVGTDASADVLVHQEDDEHFFLSVHATRSGDHIVLPSASRTTADAHWIPADRPEAAPRRIARRVHGVEYEVDHLRDPAGDRWVILTNHEAPGFRVVTAPVGDAEPEQWIPLVPHRPDTRIAEVDVLAGHVVCSERRDGLEHIRILRFEDASERLLRLPDPVYTVSVGANPDYDAPTLRYHYASMVRPPIDVDHRLDDGSEVVVRETVVPGYDPGAYRCERRWATADDGVRIPLSIVHRVDTPLDGTAPALLYGYGAYEVCIEPSFSIYRLSLLDRGFVFAIAHVRGGGEMGRDWYEQGSMLRKSTTFTDFIACARTFCAEGYTSPDRLGARGRSAGGLLMGAVSNLAPELFRAISAEVPFVDVVNTMSDPSLPLTVEEWEEWGDPLHDPDAFAAMLAYSPYDNVEAREYPAMYVAGGLNDTRVMYWEPAKWVARHRALRTDDRMLVLRTEMGAGHAGPSGRQDAWLEEAEVLAFLVDQLRDRR